MTTPRPQNRNFRILMSVDAVGGVWRYAMDLAAGLQSHGVETVFAVFGPIPNKAQLQEAQEIGRTFVCDPPLDWMVSDQSQLETVPEIISDLAQQEQVDLIHLNMPSQAAGLRTKVPVAVVSHSCVASWFEIVRGHELPADWLWQKELTRQGLQRANLVLVPSLSHGLLISKVYGHIASLTVIPNASEAGLACASKQAIIFAAGRWWDEGKNGAVLDRAAAETAWPVVMAGGCEGPNGQKLVLQFAQSREELSYSETMALMAKAGIFVSPSIYEPFGLATLEAARHGCPLILADIPTYRELWDGAALFVDPTDPSAFASAINSLIRDVDLRERLGAQAQTVSRRYTVDAQVKAIIRHYGRLLASIPHSCVAEKT